MPSPFESLPQEPEKTESQQNIETEGIKEKPEIREGVLESTEQQKILEKLYDSGRAGFHTNIENPDLQHLAGVDRGWQGFSDDKQETPDRWLGNLAGKSIFRNDDEILKKEEVDGAITIKPIKEEDRNENSPYEFSYYHPFRRTPKWANIRGGTTFSSSIVMPKQLAEETFIAVGNDPGFMREILRKFNKKVIDYLEKDGQFPVDKKVLIVPEGIDAFERDLKDRMRPVVGIKKEYIKEILDGGEIGA